MHVHLQNTGNTVAFANKLTLENGSPNQTGDSRILPSYYSDNYVSLLPGESADVTITAPESQVHGAAKVGLRGWNTATTSIAVQ